MNIDYYFRNKNAGFSIGKVFSPIVNILSQSENIQCLYMPSKYSDPVSLFKNIYFSMKNQRRNSVNHITGDIHYLCWFLPRNNLIVTVHDIWFYTLLPQGLKKSIKYLLWILPLKRAKKIVFISDETRCQVLEHIRLSNDQIEVIMNPVSPEFKKVDTPFNKEKPVILHLGMSPSKNLENLIPALKGIKCHLRLIGKLTDTYRELLLQNKIEFSYAFNLSNEQIVMEYANCDIVNLTSQHEGFGMPIIEGQASNKPVISSNLSPMKEIAGNGACLVDPYNQQEIHEAYLKMINDDGFRENVRTLGFNNVQRFSVEYISEQYKNLYKQVLI